jgi:NTE family protein
MLGGISGERKNIIPFIGARLLDYTGTNFISSLLSFQYEPFQKKYIILAGNIGYYTSDFNDFLDMKISDKQFIQGYGLTLGMNSIIGPLGVTFMAKDKLKDLLTYITVGYPF